MSDWVIVTEAVLTETTETPDGQTRLEHWTLPATREFRYFRLRL